MCGIAFSLCRDELPSELFDSVCSACSSRGPDYQDTASLVVNGFHLRFYAAVLHLRGHHVAKQPFVHDQSVLIYNGEIFDGLELDSSQNDGEELFNRLRNSESPHVVLTSVEGPYAFVYYHAKNCTLYWARDPLGRRSLLHTTINGAMFLTSVSCAPTSELSPEWTEVEAAHVYNLKLDSKDDVIKDQRHYLKAAKGNPEVPIYPFDALNPSLPSESQLLLKTEGGLPEISGAFEQALKDLQTQLESSIRKRVCDIPRLRGPAYPKARVGVLFSGGLDCTVLALLADKYLPAEEAIDLLNVAFENPRSIANAAKLRSASSPDLDVYNTPDRLTGLASASILANIRPNRTWNMVRVDVPYAEYLATKDHIIQMMKPNNTVMDLSIAQALYFAAKGTGTIQQEGKRQPYQSEARVLLSGLGADEQLGGYSRHKKAFATDNQDQNQALGGNWSVLLEELQMDLDRIGSRNLGRDDRVISSLGKEIRYPYLAGHVVAFLANLPVHLKVDYRFGEGIGDKMLLRALARQLGLGDSAYLAKRAIQFGARSAKMELGSRGSKGDSLLV